MKKKTNSSDIKDEFLACPYCMCEVSVNQLGCCGESRDHFQTAYVVGEDEEVFLDSDVTIREEERNT